MNILFVTEIEISPIQGGTEHITHTLTGAFRALGHRCCLAYVRPIDADLQPTLFDAKQQLVFDDTLPTQIGDFLRKEQINIVIVNLVSIKSKKAIMPSLYAQAHQLNTKVIACYHAMPGEDIIPSDWRHIWYQIVHCYGLNQAFKDLFLHISPTWLNRRLVRSKYKLMPEYADAFVLLSTKFYEPYLRIAGSINHANFYAVGNALSFPENIEENKIATKQPIVLIVARQQERSKRLSMALRVWQQIEKEADLKNWKLQIVGGGPDSSYYKQLHKELGLQRCELLGRQPEIVPYYESASIFMMTSSYEGFGITLTEAQQFGCVPIVQNTYASLTDIIQGEKNGIIVDSNDAKVYAQQLAQLMRDSKKREEMARAGLQSCKQFSQERVIEIWLNMFNRLLTE